MAIAPASEQVNPLGVPAIGHKSPFNDLRSGSLAGRLSIFHRDLKRRYYKLLLVAVVVAARARIESRAESRLNCLGRFRVERKVRVVVS